jgi:hypothetical protein
LYLQIITKDINRNYTLELKVYLEDKTRKSINKSCVLVIM